MAIGPLVKDAAGRDAVEGRGNIALDVTAAGATINAMKKALGGTARVALRDGAVKGINLTEALRKTKAAFGSKSAQQQPSDTAQRTDFSEMTASFVIKNGVARNDDLDVKAPALRIGGAGDIDIGNSQLNYLAKATVVATSKGQGGADLDHLAGLVIPVKLTGAFDAPKYEIDYGALGSGAAKAKAKEKVQERLRDAVQALDLAPFLDGVAGDCAGARPEERRPLRAAARIGVRAARVKRTAGGRRERVGHFARHRRSRLAGHLEVRDRVHQHARVGMPRGGEQALRLGQLDHAPEVHHADAIGDMRDHREVVRDEEVGEAEPLLQLGHQVEDLRLHRHIERRGRLVAHQELGIARKGARDRDALALAAGELVRILLAVIVRQPDLAQQLRHPRRARPARSRRGRARGSARRRCRARASAD